MERRTFLNQATTVTAGAAIMSALPKGLFAIPGKKLSAGDTINIGAIGLNGMGWGDLTFMIQHPGVRCIALCDVDSNVLSKRVAELDKQGIKVTAYTDHRKLLENKDIDAVIVATPDHWHCLIMTDACQAGKDVYVEKPAGNSIVECALMTQSAEYHQRVVQVGQWQRSQKHFADALDFVHSGKLGKIRLVKAWAYMNWEGAVPKKPDAPVPTGVDYTQWLGPATERPFNPNRFHFNFRWFWDYGGGQMTDWGVHMLDYALMGMNAGMPKSVSACGGKFAFPDDATETPDTMTALYEFDGFTIQWEHATGIGMGPYGMDHGIAFIGNNGTLVVNRNGWQVMPEMGVYNKPLIEAVEIQKPVDNGILLNTGNFINVVRSRKFDDLKVPIQAGAHVATIAQMGNIAYKVRDQIHWNDADKKFDERAANHYLAANYHNGYKLPKI
jgi:predicted dehydrogenase